MNAMNALVTIVGDEARTDTMTIAEGTDTQHKNVIALVRKYLVDLEECGEVAFETRLNPQGTPTEIALLNQEQFTLIGTYMKNTEIVRAFKKRLVRAFFDLARKDSVRRTVESSQRPEVEAAGIFEVYNRLGRSIGFDENMAAFSANNATRTIISVNVLELMGVTASALRRRAGPDLGGDLEAVGEFSGIQVKGGLQVDPELRRRAEVSREPKRRVRGDATPLQHDVVDTR